MKIQCRKAADIARDVCAKNQGNFYALKIDVEGSEYQIIPNLDEAGWIKIIDAVILEYHDKPFKLIDILNKNGFRCYLHGSNGLGIIAAVRDDYPL